MTGACILAILYLVTASVTVQYTRFEGGVALIWISTSLLVADLRRRSASEWPLRMAMCGGASAMATTIFGIGAEAALPLAFVNIAEAGVAAALLRRYAPDAADLGTIKDALVLMGVAGCLAPAVTAFPAASIAAVAIDVPYWPNWLAWFMGHGLGAVTLIPLAILVADGEVVTWIRRADRMAWLEATLHLAGVAGASFAAFCQDHLPLLFLPFLPMLVTTFRLGRLGAAAALLLLTVIGSIFTLLQTGPIVLIAGQPSAKIEFFQLYLACATLMVLPVAAELKRKRKLFQRLRTSAAFYQVLADRTGDIILALHVDGKIRFASPSIERIGGFRPSEVVGRAAIDIVVEEDRPQVQRTHGQALSRPDETFMVEYRARKATGELGWFETHTRAIVDEAGAPTGAVSVIREISDRKARERSLIEAATTDALTGLRNRRGFEEAHRRLVQASGPPACLALFDLDHFKKVNDRYGHATGDIVLRTFARTLKESLRDSDIAARLGGEEFAVLLIGPDISHVSALCDRVLERISASPMTTVNGSPVHVTVSCGLSTLDAHTSLDEGMRAADAALYRAKAAGRNRLALAA